MTFVFNGNAENTKLEDDFQAVSNNRSKLRYGIEKFLRETALFSNVTPLTFPYQQALDRQGLVGRTHGTSY